MKRVLVTMEQLGDASPTVVVDSALSNGSPSKSITKPGETQGFIKVMYSTAPITTPPASAD